MTLSGPQTGTATTDADGNYSFKVPARGDYTVTPSKANYTFTPASRTFSALASNQTADFAAALAGYSIAGRVTENGVALSGVAVALSGPQTGTATTDADGNYAFNVSAGGNYTVTPALSGYDFTPAGRAFNAVSSNQIGNFTAAATPTQGPVYDVVANFSGVQNPTGAWSYG